MPFQTTHVHFTSNLKPTEGKYYAVLTTRTTAGPTSWRGSCPMSWSVLKRHGHFQFSNKILHEKKGSRQNLCGGAVQGCICQLRYVYSICAVVNCTAWCTDWYWGVIGSCGLMAGPAVFLVSVKFSFKCSWTENLLLSSAHPKTILSWSFYCT